MSYVKKITTIEKAGLCYAIQTGRVSPVSDLCDDLSWADLDGMPDGSRCETFADYMYMCEGCGIKLVEAQNV